MKNLLPKIAIAAFTTAVVTTSLLAAPQAVAKTAISTMKPLPFDTIPANGGVIKITPIIHASIQIEYRGKVILVDPISAGTYRKKADLILITHSHADHFDPAIIKKVSSGYVHIFAPPAILATLKETYSRGFFPMSNGSVTNFNTNGGGKKTFLIQIGAVPAYNIKRGPDATHKFHPKGAFNGYVLTLGGKRIYIAGDTEATPEMKALKNIDAAFIPMNLPYTMTPQEAAVGVRAFKPRVVYPYHFRYPFNVPNTNVQQFITAMKGSKTQVRVLDWYNAAPVARFMAAMKK